ncbi:midcut-by-XrtH protein [Seongchinamella unica]|uniref:Midcut-by-XrtH protein n=1 Tax=Seongchinamella unica TaxID=2547392 RepID=A0A4R5LMV3_9GAMM|nr:midcut-by-XrtH protein [Seongchinamella unica]TDG11390.1 midcut-by-XrtH protein [Seongchinamella unica]
MSFSPLRRHSTLLACFLTSAFSHYAAAQAPPTGAVTYGPAVVAAVPTTSGIALTVLALVMAFLAIKALRSRHGMHKAISVTVFCTASAVSLIYGLRAMHVEAIVADVTVDGAECASENTEPYDPSATGVRLVSNCPDNDIVISALDLEGCAAATPDADTCTTGTSLSDTESCGLPSCENTPPPVAGACQGGAVKLSTSPGGDMVVCDDPTNTTCEEDAETLCPVGMQLCNFDQYNERNDGWDYPVGGPTNPIVVAEIFCRVDSGAGHFTLGPYGGVTNLGQDTTMNCGYGSSRESCTATYGCNEQSVQALCCFPSPTCGNGVVDSPEEQCDDGNADETDDCLNSCAWRVPGDHGFSTATGC